MSSSQTQDERGFDDLDMLTAKDTTLLTTRRGPTPTTDMSVTVLGAKEEKKVAAKKTLTERRRL
ncbi:MAG: hypothetical protein GY820_04610 [Gammaproteobacteria bacterium]|nr:hypothetical protein [Gammaproteobacteria bacterium]